MADLPPDLADALRELAEAELAHEAVEARSRWRTDPKAFRMEARRLETGALYGQVYEPWQEEHFFEPVYAGKSLWNEGPRGHDRTDGEGWAICDRLQHGPPNQRIDIFAADRDQAGFPLERVERYTREDRDLFPDVRVQKHEILGPRGSIAVVNSADVAGSLGGKPTEVWVEEIGVWPEKGQRLWNSIVGSCTKLGAPIRVLTNAGAGKVGNWRWQVREWFRGMAEAHPDRYHFWSSPGWVAKWSLGRRKELEGAFASENERRRFLDNVWLDQDESPAFSAQDIEAVFAGPAYRLAPDGKTLQIQGEEKPRRVLALLQATDYGLVNDALCAGVAALVDGDLVFLVEDYAAAGRPGDQASLLAVEAWMLGNMRRLPISGTHLDPYQAVHTMQEHGPALCAQEYLFSQTSKRRHYAALLSRLRARTFRARPGAFRRKHANGQEYDLRRELFEAIEKMGPAGSWMTHPEGGHDDGAVTCAMLAEKFAEVSLAPARVYFPKARAPESVLARGFDRDPRSRFR